MFLNKRRTPFEHNGDVSSDAQPLQDGLSLEGELARRHERKARLQQARAEQEIRKSPDRSGLRQNGAAILF
jgi:hypothetical protein